MTKLFKSYSSFVQAETPKVKFWELITGVLLQPTVSEHPRLCA